MARRTDKNGVSWEVDAQGNPVPGTGIRPSNMGIDPMRPADLQKAANEADASQYAPEIERQKIIDAQAQRELDRKKFEFDKQKAAAALAEKGLKMLPDGSVVAIEGGAPKPQKDNTERKAQIKSILDNIGNLRKQADDWLAVGKQSGNVGEWPLIGGMLGQNRADVEGILSQIQGDMIQQVIADMSANNGGNGVATMANSETEAARLAASIANLDPNQSYEQFVQGIQKAEDYYTRSLEAIEPQKTRADFKRGSGTETSFDGGEYLTDDDQRTGGILQFRFDRGGGPNELNQALQDENQKRVQQGLEPYDLYRPGTPQWNQLGEAIKYRDAGNKGAKISPPVSGYQESSLLGDFAGSTPGAFAMKAGNAAAMGLPAYMDSGNTNMALDYAGENSPISSFLGETAGLITGASGIGKFGAETVGRLAPKIMEGGKWGNTIRGALTDGTQGALYGGFNDGDPATGALAMGGGRLAGDGIGRIGARALRKPGVAMANAGGNIGNKALAAAGKEPYFPSVEYAPKLEKPDALTLGRIGVDTTQQLQDAQRLGLPMALADTNPALQKLAGSAVRKSDDALNYATQNIEPRGMGQAERAQNAISTQFTPPVDPKKLSGAIRQQAREASQPFYEAAFARPAPVNDELAALLETPTLKESLNDAARIASNEGLDPKGLGFDFNDAGDVIGIQNPTWRTLDLIKRGLDQKLAPFRDPFGRLNLEGNPLGQSIESLRKKYVSTLDSQVGADDYIKARSEYAKNIAPRASLQEGGQAFASRVPPRDVQDTLGRLTPEQTKTYQQGYATTLADKVDNVRGTSNPYKTIYGSPAQRSKADSIFPGNEFGKVYDIENAMAGTRAETLYGSQTAARGQADNAFGGNAAANVAEMGGAAITGMPPVGMIARGIQTTIGDAVNLGSVRKQGQIASAIAPRLLEPNPTSALQYLDEAFIKKAALEAQQAQGRRLGGMFGAALAPVPYAYSQSN